MAGLANSGASSTIFAQFSPGLPNFSACDISDVHRPKFAPPDPANISPRAAGLSAQHAFCIAQRVEAGVRLSRTEPRGLGPAVCRAAGVLFFPLFRERHCCALPWRGATAMQWRRRGSARAASGRAVGRSGGRAGRSGGTVGRPGERAAERLGGRAVGRRLGRIVGGAHGRGVGGAVGQVGGRGRRGRPDGQSKFGRDGPRFDRVRPTHLAVSGPTLAWCWSTFENWPEVGPTLASVEFGRHRSEIARWQQDIGLDLVEIKPMLVEMGGSKFVRSLVALCRHWLNSAQHRSKSAPTWPEFGRFRPQCRRFRPGRIRPNLGELARFGRSSASIPGVCVTLVPERSLSNTAQRTPGADPPAPTHPTLVSRPCVARPASVKRSQAIGGERPAS